MLTALINVYLLVIQHRNGKWPFLVTSPLEHGDFP